MAKYKSESEQEVIRFIKILIGVVIVILGFFLFTKSFVNKEYDINDNTKKGEIDSHMIMAGSIFNRPYDKYYVLAYDSKDANATIIQNYVGLYEKKEESSKIYVVDLGNELNKKYYGKEDNKSNSLDELKMKTPTLLKIENKKIAKFITNKDEIKKELGI